MAASTLGNAWLVSEDDKPLKKKKRIVKHKKKAWRITSDVSDVERFLENERLEERLGAPFSERPNDSIFVLDTSVKTVDQKIPQPVGKKKKLKEIGPLKCHSILIPSSAVPDPIKKRNRVRTPEERQDPLVKRILEERRAQGKLPARYVQALKHWAQHEEKVANKGKPEKLRSKFDFDLWGPEGEEIVIGDPDVVKSELPEEVKKYTLEQTCKRVYSRPSSNIKTSSLPAVEHPHPGTSYNPVFEDHQQLLKKAIDIETKEMIKEAKIRRKTALIMTKIPGHQKEAQWMSEMSQGLADEDGPTNSDATGKTGENDSEAPLPKQTRPKTMKQKRKFKLHKLREIRRKQIKERKKRLAQIDRLRSIRREIRAADERSAARILKRQKMKEDKLAKPKTIGRYKYEAPPLEVNLSEEIAGNLRQLKVEGNILIDRFKSLQRRNIIEPRVKQRVVRKYKPKKYIKRSHKETAGTTR